MLLLAADTSGKHGSIALARCEPEKFQLIELVPLTGGMFSAQLVPEIAALLYRHRLSKNDIEGFAVASGPGSFTGLRVGLAAIKGLAEVLQKPIAAVSLLQLVAEAAGRRGRVIGALDAGRGEVYVGEYECGPDGGKLTRESLLPLAELSAMAGPSVTLASPDQPVAARLENEGVVAQLVARPTAGDVAREGFRRITRGDTVSPADLEANYIRRADAEIFSKGGS